MYDILITRGEMHACIIASCHIKRIFENTVVFVFVNKKENQTRKLKILMKTKEPKWTVVRNHKVPIICVKSSTNSD